MGNFALPTLPKECLHSWLEIDLAAIAANYETMRNLTPRKTAFAVVKADAYGHGAIRAAKHLERVCKPAKFAVARLEEAMQLREAGIANTPILILAAPLPTHGARICDGDFESIVYTTEHIAMLEQSAKDAVGGGKVLKVHLKTDVGMGRVGCTPDDTPELAALVRKSPHLKLEGVMAHLPCADMPPPERTRAMITKFEGVRNTLIAADLRPTYFHLANSACTLDFPEAHFDAVRIGICLYGQLPSLEVINKPNLIPAMTLRSRIAMIKTVAPGTGISYGHLFTAQHETKVASLPLGYAEGVPRSATNTTHFMVRDTAVSQIGRVCMDALMVDVTGVPDVQVGDVATIFGDKLPVELFARDAATIGYEITTRIGKRLQVFYSPTED